jgi:hypothetical protein
MCARLCNQQFFRHIHEGAGVTTDGTTIFVNASTCDYNYRPINQPVVFDIPIPQAKQEDDDDDDDDDDNANETK